MKESAAGAWIVTVPLSVVSGAAETPSKSVQPASPREASVSGVTAEAVPSIRKVTVANAPVAVTVERKIRLKMIGSLSSTTSVA